MKIVFAGTPEFAVPSLRSLLGAGHAVVAVYTQPDRPAGRGRRVTTSPVKDFAVGADIPVEQPATLRNETAVAMLSDWGADLMVVAAYGLILPQAVLDLPRLGCWNVHASLLPRWRGAAPIQRAILAGDDETGVCIMQMEAGLDTGPVLRRVETLIGPRETAGELHDRLARLGGAALVAAISERDRIEPKLQPDEGVTYAHKIETAEAQLNWNQPSAALDRQVRAFNPWPVARGVVADEALRVWSAVPVENTNLAPGRTRVTPTGALRVGTADGALELMEVQRPGGRRVAIADYLNGRPELRG